MRLVFGRQLGVEVVHGLRFPCLAVSTSPRYLVRGQSSSWPRNRTVHAIFPLTLTPSLSSYPPLLVTIPAPNFSLTMGNTCIFGITKKKPPAYPPTASPPAGAAFPPGPVHPRAEDPGGVPDGTRVAKTAERALGEWKNEERRTRAEQNPCENPSVFNSSFS